MEQNPYTAPSTASPILETEAGTIRKAHIQHEASVKSVGYLYYLGGLFLMFAAIPGLIVSSGEGVPTNIVGSLFMILFAILQFWVGRSIHKLKSWSRIPTGILSGIGLLAFPVGTLINAYILYLIFGKKGLMIFSSGYQEIVAETPDIKYKTSKAVWIVLLVVVLLIAGIITWAAVLS